MGRSLAAMVLLAMIAFTGCGGEDKDDGKIESKADFVVAADKICVERDARSKALSREPGTDVGRLARDLAAAYMTSITKLEALALPPGADRAGAQKYVESVSAMRRPVQRMQLSAEKFGASDTVAEIKVAGTELGTNINTVQAISDLADQNARMYGMKSCGDQQSLPIS